METMYMAVGSFVITLLAIIGAGMVAYVIHRGVSVILKEARLGRGCVLISDEEVMGRR